MCFHCFLCLLSFVAGLGEIKNNLKQYNTKRIELTFCEYTKVKVAEDAFLGIIKSGSFYFILANSFLRSISKSSETMVKRNS